MKGKEICRSLKEIRRKIAEENDIVFITTECTYQGECSGTCPKCEAELAYLEKKLETRKKLGKVAILAGISAGLGGSLTACAPLDAISEFISEQVSPTHGAIPAHDVDIRQVP